MNNVKRMLALVLSLVLVLALAACTQAPAESNPSSSSTAPSSSSTTPSSSTQPEKKVTFRVKVVDEEGNPVAGVGVQLCKDACIIAETNEEGWAEFDKDVEDGYHANIAYALNTPDDKKVDATEFDFASGETEMTLTLKFVDKN